MQPGRGAAGLQYWQSPGGELTFGCASEVSCFLLLYAHTAAPGRIRPFTIYSNSGTIEVFLPHMRRGPVFDDIALRDEFRRHLQVAGITIQESELNLRPSFGADTLRDPVALAAVEFALEWFAIIFRTRLAMSLDSHN